MLFDKKCISMSFDIWFYRFYLAENNIEISFLAIIACTHLEVHLSSKNVAIDPKEYQKEIQIVILSNLNTR